MEPSKSDVEGNFIPEIWESIGIYYWDIFNIVGIYDIFPNIVGMWIWDMKSDECHPNHDIMDIVPRSMSQLYPNEIRNQ